MKTMRTLFVNLEGKNVITKGQAEKAGLADRFAEWLRQCEDLYELAVEYGKEYESTRNGGACANIRFQIDTLWNRMLLFVGGTECRLFALNRDADTFRTWATGLTIYAIAGAGRGFAVTGKKSFRKYVETLVYCRMRERAVMSRKDYEVLVAYTTAEKAVKSLTEEVKSLNGEKKLINGRLQDMKSVLESCGLDVTTLNIQIVSALNAEIKKLDESISKAESSLEEANKVISDNEAEYNRIKNLISSVESVEEK